MWDIEKIDLKNDKGTSDAGQKRNKSLIKHKL